MTKFITLSAEKSFPQLLVVTGYCNFIVSKEHKEMESVSDPNVDPPAPCNKKTTQLLGFQVS